MSGLIDLSRLPAPDVVETIEFEAILASRKARLLEALPADLRANVAAVLALESEPLTKLLEENAWRETVLRQRINEAARAVMLASAAGADLDQLAANVNLERFEITPANPEAFPPIERVMEGDEDLRARVQLAFEAMSVAGPRSAYIAHGLNADPRVADITAESPEPCEVAVTVMARAGNGAAPPDLVAAVQAALNDERIRPLGDRVTFQGATIVDYSIAATLYVFSGPEAEVILAAARSSAEAYAAKQRRLGRDIRRSAVIASLHVEGVQRVELTAPAADVVLGKHQAGHCTGIQIAAASSDD